MIKHTLLSTMALLMVGTTSSAETVKGTIRDVYVTVTETVPYTKQDCSIVEVPVYGSAVRQGNATEGALLGMIIGGIAGKGLTGKDKGAAAGAVMGGLIGADKGSKPKTETVITGYRKERQCEEVTSYQQQTRQAYSHSTIRFTVNGYSYVEKFQRASR